MELWIRSQDKEKLKKIVDLKYQYGTLQDANLKVIVGTTQYDEWDVLGSYETKERCLQILDEIQNILNPMLIFKNCECTKDVLDSIKEVGACIVHDNAKLEQINICVFEMPEV